MTSFILIVVALGFAWNLGVHYTGAAMGMPYASRAITAGPALLLIGIFTILGATFASGRVEKTVGLHIIAAAHVPIPTAIVIVLAAGTLTTMYNYLKIPTSTIQILVFCIVGVGLSGGIPIDWATIARLAAVWVTAPFLAFALGFLLTRVLDLVISPVALADLESERLALIATRPDVSEIRASPIQRWFPAVARASRPIDSPVDTTPSTRSAPVALRWLPVLLVLVGVAASFVLGANDVANATGQLVMTHQFSWMVAGLLGGVAMAVGSITWGRRILQTVAFDVVHMDLTMASAAQGVQALVVLLAVTQGLFTSMNQALIGAMAGTGIARGRQTVQTKQVKSILRGWLVGPLSGVLLAGGAELPVRIFGW